MSFSALHGGRVAAAFASLIALGACASNSDNLALNGQRSVFHNPYGVGLIFPTPATTEHPPYVICNGDRCALLDENGNFTQMSDNERRSWRLGLQLAEENRQFNLANRHSMPDPPEFRDEDSPAQRLPDAGKPLPD